MTLRADAARNREAIVEAAREQSTGLKEINHAVNLMDQATQQNAAMVEQTSAAARNLAGEVGGLAEQAARFRTGRGDDRDVPHRARGGRVVALRHPIVAATA